MRDARDARPPRACDAVWRAATGVKYRDPTFKQNERYRINAQVRSTEYGLDVSFF